MWPCVGCRREAVCTFDSRINTYTCIRTASTWNMCVCVFGVHDARRVRHLDVNAAICAATRQRTQTQAQIHQHTSTKTTRSFERVCARAIAHLSAQGIFASIVRCALLSVPTYDSFSSTLVVSAYVTVSRSAESQSHRNSIASHYVRFIVLFSHPKHRYTSR